MRWFAATLPVLLVGPKKKPAGLLWLRVFPLFGNPKWKDALLLREAPQAVLDQFYFNVGTPLLSLAVTLGP